MTKEIHLLWLKHHSESRHSAANNAEKSRSMSWPCLTGDVGGHAVGAPSVPNNRDTRNHARAVLGSLLHSTPECPWGGQTVTHIPAMPSAPSPSRQAKDAALLHSSNAWCSPQFVQAMAVFDVTSARRSPSDTLAPSSARSTQDQDFAFRYMPLTLGLPLGFPGIEEVLMTDIYIYTHILAKKQPLQKGPGLFLRCALMNDLLQKPINNISGFQGNLLPFWAKLKLLHIVPSEQGLQESFYGLAGCQNGRGRRRRSHEKYSFLINLRWFHIPEAGSCWFWRAWHKK